MSQISRIAIRNGRFNSRQSTAYLLCPEIIQNTFTENYVRLRLMDEESFVMEHKYISILQIMAKHLLIKKVRKGKEREWEIIFYCYYSYIWGTW